MGSNFVWTDALVAEFTTWSMTESPLHQGRYKDIEDFKIKKSKESKPIQDWKIVSIKVDNVVWTNDGGKYYSDKYGLGYLHKMPNDAKIQSVRRISTNEVFSIDEVCGHKDYNSCYRFTIESFYLRHTNIIACKGKTDNYVPVDFTIENWVKIKPKVALFTCLDGVDIFDQDDYWWVNTSNFGYAKSKAFKNCLFGDKDCVKYFSIEEKAKEYIKEHQSKVALFTTEDGVEIYYSKERVWEVFSNWCSGSIPINILIDHKKSPDGVKYFSTSEKALEYIIQNKPIQVSFKEIDDYFKKVFGNTYYPPNYLKQFFKSKINNG